MKTEAFEVDAMESDKFQELVLDHLVNRIEGKVDRLVADKVLG